MRHECIRIILPHKNMATYSRFCGRTTGSIGKCIHGLEYDIHHAANKILRSGSAKQYPFFTRQ